MKYYLLIIFIIGNLFSNAQYPVKITVQNSTLAAGDSVLPFWHSANAYGKVNATNSWLNITDLNVRQFSSPTTESSFGLNWGINLVGALGEKHYFQMNQLFAGMEFKGWQLKAGMFHEAERYAGLSTSNGNLVRSVNARPYPVLRFSTVDFKPVPGLQNKVLIKAEYDEGLLNDNRFVENVHLHHKSLYFRFIPAVDWEITAGMEHFVMWGGTSPDERIGAMPVSFKAYLHYVLGSSGDETFPQTDQANVAGNQLGTYQIEITKSFSTADIALYVSHLFEDLSGINLRNWPDNLLGIHFRFTGEKKLISDVVYEFIHTKHQSIRDFGNMEPDNYFNHGIYKSGFTYHQQMLGSPLFFPLKTGDGKSLGLVSNRFVAHHLAGSGFLSESVSWKGLLTGIKHEGTMRNPYPSRQITISGLAEVEYSNPEFPVVLGLSVAADAGSKNCRNVGLSFQASKSW